MKTLHPIEIFFLCSLIALALIKCFEGLLSIRKTMRTSRRRNLRRYEQRFSYTVEHVKGLSKQELFDVGLEIFGTVTLYKKKNICEGQMRLFEAVVVDIENEIEAQGYLAEWNKAVAVYLEKAEPFFNSSHIDSGFEEMDKAVQEAKRSWGKEGGSNG